MRWRWPTVSAPRCSASPASCAARRSPASRRTRSALLVAIKYAPGVTVGELAADERVSTAAMSKRVSRLERDGLVARTQSEADRRCVGLTLTEEGQRVLRRVRSRRTAWLASRLGALSPTSSPRSSAAVEPLARLLEPRRRARDEGRAAHVPQPPLPQLPPLLRRPDRLPDRLVDAADRARLVRPPADALAVRRRRDGVRAVPAVHAVRAVRRRPHRPARRAPHGDRRRRRRSSSPPRRSPGSRSAASRSRGCSTRSRSSTGTVLVLDVPSRQQLTYRMVGRDDLPNAIALNSTLFNASRIFGPAVAGIVLVAGAGICFLVNAISFLAVLIGLLAMRVSEFFPLEEFERPTILARHARGARLGAPAAADARPPRADVRAQHVLLQLQRHAAGAREGHAARAQLRVRAPLGGLRRGRARRRARRRLARTRVDRRCCSSAALVFTGARAPARARSTRALLAGVLLFLIGAGFTAWSANSNAIMQLAAPDHLRGRIIGLYFYAFNGTGAIAGIMTGWLCAAGGTELAFVVSGIVGLVATVGAALALGWTPRLTTRRRAAEPQHA